MRLSFSPKIYKSYNEINTIEYSLIDILGGIIMYIIALIATAVVLLTMDAIEYFEF